MSQPNIVFLLSDQHNADIMGWRDDPWVRTPNFDALASQGTALTNCYCASPLCVPSRSSLLSTLLPQRMGIFTNDQCLPSDRITFVHELAIAGYRTVLTGRMHFKGPDQRHGFHERLVGDIGNTNWGADKPSKGKREYHIYGAGHRSLEESAPGASRILFYDRAVIDGACQRMKDHDGVKPLFMTVGLYGPHNPYVCDKERFDHHYRTLPRPTPSPVPDDLHPDVRKAYERTDMLNPDPEAVHRSRAAYYGLVETLDDHLGRLMAAARDAFGEDVVFVYGSDHGDMAGSHGTFWKQSFYDGASKVPLMISGKDIGSGARLDTPTSLMDLGPTLLSVGKAEAMIETDGVDLWPAILGEQELDDDRVVISQLANRQPAQRPGAMIRRGRYKLIYHDIHDPRPQLFDMEEDPNEQTDLGVAPDGKLQNLIESLCARLREDWDPEAADHVAKLGTKHMRRLHLFDKEHPDLPSSAWRGDFDEVRLS